MKEFRKIPMLDFLYEISAEGVLRNVKSKKVISGHLGKDGYVSVHLRHPKNARYLLHRIVAAVWLGLESLSRNGFDVHHIDGNKSNNRVSNLRVVSTKEHKDIHGTVDMIVGLARIANSRKVRLWNDTEDITFSTLEAAARFIDPVRWNNMRWRLRTRKFVQGFNVEYSGQTAFVSKAGATYRRPVVINGVEYPSITNASKAIGGDNYEHYRHLLKNNIPIQGYEIIYKPVETI